MNIARSSAYLRYRGFALVEDWFGIKATSTSDIPHSVDAITPEWLTGIMCAAVPGARVEAIEMTGGSDGTTSRRAIKVTYNAAGMAAGLQTRLFTKCTSDWRSRLLGVLIGKIENEIGFYNHFRAGLDIEALDALYARFDPFTGRTAMVFEDMVATRDVTFLDPFSYISLDDAKGMVALLAQYHATYWRSPKLAAFDWIKTPLSFQQRKNRVMDWRGLAETGMDRAEGFLPPELRTHRDHLWSIHMKSLDLASREPVTLTHGDMHVGNWYKTAEGRMGLADWGMTRGLWAYDVAYAISSALEIEDRRNWEREILEHYLACLGRNGVADVPTFDAAWLAYRQQMLHPFYYWCVTLGASKAQPDMQPKEISVRNLARMGQAMTDHDSVKAVDQAG